MAAKPKFFPSSEEVRESIACVARRAGFSSTPRLTRRGNIHCEIANVLHCPLAPTEAASIDFRDSAGINRDRMHGDRFFCPSAYPSQSGRQLCKLVSWRLLPRSRLSSGVADSERARRVLDDDGRRYDAVRPRLKMAATVPGQPMACLLRRGRQPGGPLRFRAAERVRIPIVMANDLAVQQPHRRFMHARVARGDDTAAGLRRLAVPGSSSRCPSRGRPVPG